MAADATFDQLCAKARDAVSAGKYKDAKILYAQAIADQPDSADARYGLATCCFLLGEYEAAIQHFRAVVDRDPTRATAYINLGALYNRLGQQDEAIAHLRKGLQLDSKRAEGYYNLGIAYRHKGLTDLAIQAYREATRLNPKMADAYLNLANALLDVQRYNEAISAYKQALEVRPSFDKAQQGLRNAERALAAQKAVSAAPTAALSAPTTVVATAEQAQPFATVVERTEAIDAVRMAATRQEELTRELARVVEAELSPALHDLSHSLVQSSSAQSELDVHVRQYETSLQNLRVARRSMIEGMDVLRKLGERFAASANTPARSG
jgi:tetratricopeptide (TPR) repeat protein